MQDVDQQGSIIWFFLPDLVTSTLTICRTIMNIGTCESLPLKDFVDFSKMFSPISPEKKKEICWSDGV